MQLQYQFFTLQQYKTLCSGLQRGGGPITPGCKNRQWAFCRADTTGHPAVLHRLQTTGPAQHEMETTTGSLNPPESSADVEHTYSFLLSLGFPPTFLPAAFCPHLPKWMLSSIYLDPPSSCSLILKLPACVFSFLPPVFVSFGFSHRVRADFTLCQPKHTRGLRVVPLPVYLFYLNTALCSPQHFVTKHQWTLFSQNTSHILGSRRTWMSWSDPLRDLLSLSQRVEHVSALEGKSWRSLFASHQKQREEKWCWLWIREWNPPPCWVCMSARAYQCTIKISCVGTPHQARSRSTISSFLYNVLIRPLESLD